MLRTDGDVMMCQVTNQPQFTPPPLYTIPEAAVAKPTMQTSQPAWQTPPFAGRGDRLWMETLRSLSFAVT